MNVFVKTCNPDVVVTIRCSSIPRFSFERIESLILFKTLTFICCLNINYLCGQFMIMTVCSFNSPSSNVENRISPTAWVRRKIRAKYEKFGTTIPCKIECTYTMLQCTICVPFCSCLIYIVHECVYFSLNFPYL